MVFKVFFRNIMGDKLLLNFGAKFQRQFIITYRTC